MEEIQATSRIRALIASLNQILNRVAVFLCILTYILTGNTISASYAYIITSFHSYLKNVLIRNFPLAIKASAEAIVSIRRMKKFLLYEELQIDSDQSVKMIETLGIEKFQKYGIKQFKEGEASICMENVFVKWLASSPEYNLENVNFEVSLHENILLYFINGNFIYMSNTCMRFYFNVIGKHVMIRLRTFSQNLAYLT